MIKILTGFAIDTEEKRITYLNSQPTYLRNYIIELTNGSETNHFMFTGGKWQPAPVGFAPPDFVNGFTSYLETFFQLSTMIQHYFDNNWQNDKIDSEIKHTQAFHGHQCLGDLAREWTEEFEAAHAGEPWDDLDWFDTLEDFFNMKNNEHPINI